jgi:hypothetical protein
MTREGNGYHSPLFFSAEGSTMSPFPASGKGLVIEEEVGP